VDISTKEILFPWHSTPCPFCPKCARYPWLWRVWKHHPICRYNMQGSGCLTPITSRPKQDSGCYDQTKAKKHQSCPPSAESTSQPRTEICQRCEHHQSPCHRLPPDPHETLNQITPFSTKPTAIPVKNHWAAIENTSIAFSLLEEYASEGSNDRKYQPNHSQYSEKTTTLPYQCGTCLRTFDHVAMNSFLQSLDTGRERPIMDKEIFLDFAHIRLNNRLFQQERRGQT
jgi:hypothetical protein